MAKPLHRSPRVRRLNRRQRKKLRVGEFQERVFTVRIGFMQALGPVEWFDFTCALADLLEPRGLAIGGLAGPAPVAATNATVSSARRGSPDAADRAALDHWLRTHPQVARHEVGELTDGWSAWASDGSAPAAPAATPRCPGQRRRL